MKHSENKIAYFSMEIGFSNDVPTYSGGLGVLAGDTLKSFADIGVDVVAVTLLSEKGYFFQKFDASGYQQELDYNWSMSDLLDKLPVEVTIHIEGRTVHVNVWQYVLTGVQGKQLRIFFLDTNNEKNNPQDQMLTRHLYGGDHDYRLKQELVLGIGGMRVLDKLGIYPRKYHMNEGHAAFLISQLYNDLDVSDKRKAIRSLCSFTTHTPVAAGHDRFPKEKVKHYFPDIPDQLFNDSLEGDEFSMTRLALNYSSYVNAVSRKHQDVTKSMFPNYVIDYITNGIHTLSWVNKHVGALYDKHIIDWRVNPLELRNALKIPTEDLLRAHQKAKQQLIDYIAQNNDVQLDPEVFTIGFARRATGYKRAHLLFRDLNRLKDISKKHGKIQLVFAGKAHPQDDEGKKIIQSIIGLSKRLTGSVKLVFVENYSISIAKLLTAGVDLWLNTPKRPLEASGTSGMKAVANGVPNLSVPDGWWVEGLIEGLTGWGIGEEIITETDDRKIDDSDANELYKKLEIILPLYYEKPNDYAVVMRNAIAINASYFNTHRMAKQYLVRAYAREN